ncbi:hypothetical protein GMRT_14953 [Giardia muris]|uniref:Uncharacterized protein n=1 Tax=Giardia muris TaxID=5742 RepID=A0A4Z1SWE2_GIAMU|nr:hypothetical protein GMRT_14953 [Giardia muris]|eukprot:TNJ29185.1 hypothetical protein GMRT_14953 [Giardia muris]
MPTQSYSFGVLPRFLERTGTFHDFASVAVGNASEYGPLVTFLRADRASLQIHKSLERPVRYQANKEIRDELLTCMGVGKCGLGNTCLFLGFERGIAIVLNPHAFSILAAAEVPKQDPIRFIIQNDVTGDLCIVTDKHFYLSRDFSEKVTGAQYVQLDLKEYTISNAASAILACNFVSFGSNGEVRLVIVFASGRISLYSTVEETFLQPATDNSISIPLVGSKTLLTAAYIPSATEHLYLGTYDGVLYLIPYNTLTPEQLSYRHDGPISAISGLGRSVYVGTLNGRIYFDGVLLSEDELNTISCLLPLSFQRPEVLVGTERWTVIHASS